MDDWAREMGIVKTLNLDAMSKSTRRRHEKRALRAGRW
jgi:hypothetical protein